MNPKDKKKKKNGKLFTIPMIICTAILIIVLAGTLLAPFITKYNPDKVDILKAFEKPSASHLLGTDNLGRDEFTRLLYGGRTTMINALIAVMISVVIGIPLGLLCGYYGGLLDTLIMRLWDCILAFPALLLAFILVAAFGKGSYNAVIAIGIVYIPMISKLARSMAITEKTKAYVEACKTFGYSGARIIFVHILPNCVATLLAELTLDFGTAVMSLASLSFLGLGVQLPKSDWGAMLQEGMAVILKEPTLIMYPAIIIVLTVVSLNVVSDSIQMYLDPEQRKLPTFKQYRRKFEKMEVRREA
ncbi:MAG: ABC transporter permease [Lachnospiraceae bacterium]|nr:ABC transporter permease [Lachnospiraceae bacterium]